MICLSFWAIRQNLLQGRVSFGLRASEREVTFPLDEFPEFDPEWRRQYQNAFLIKMTWRWRSSLNASTSDQLASTFVCAALS